MNDLVTVVTLNAGRSGHLNRLLEGLARGSPPHECVVVQMGQDATAAGPLPFVLREVRLGGSGLPLAAARNAGRRVARSGVLVFLDVDCIPSADMVDALAAGLREHDGLLCCEVTYLPAGAVSDGWTEAALRRAGRRHPARVFPAEGVQPAAQPGLFWSLAFAVRAATFDRIGGFDEGFDGYGAEDTDFAFRAAALHIPVLLSARGQAFHQRHAAYDPPLQHFADIMRNAERFHATHGVWPMRGWIDAFIAMGMVEETATGGFAVRRPPTALEIAAAALPDDHPF